MPCGIHTVDVSNSLPNLPGSVQPIFYSSKALSSSRKLPESITQSCLAQQCVAEKVQSGSSVRVVSSVDDYARVLNQLNSFLGFLLFGLRFGLCRRVKQQITHEFFSRTYHSDGKIIRFDSIGNPVTGFQFKPFCWGLKISSLNVKLHSNFLDSSNFEVQSPLSGRCHLDIIPGHFSAIVQVSNFFSNFYLR